MDFTFPAAVTFECNGCGLCCGDTKDKTRHILLLESEAQTIAAKTNLAVDAFTQPVADKSPYVYEMQKPAEGKCFFLKNNQCTIYELRPLICHFYPFELKYSADQALYVFDFTLECPTIGKGKSLTKRDFEELFNLAEQRLP